MIITMELKKITNDHYIIVDDSEIKEGDWYLWNSSIIKNHIVPTTEGDMWSNDFHKGKKITHSTKPLETLKNEYAWYGGDNKVKQKDFSKIISICLQEVKELIGEVDVEKKAERDRLDTGWEDSANLPYTSGFIRGYNQAIEDNNDKKYDEVLPMLLDCLNILKQYESTSIGKTEINIKIIQLQRLIQSLQPKTEWEVEFIDGKLKLK